MTTPTPAVPPVIQESKQATENQLWRAFLAAGLEPSLRPTGGGRSVTRRRWLASISIQHGDQTLLATGDGATRKVALRRLLNSLVDKGIAPLAIWATIDPRAHGNPRATETAAADSTRRRRYPERLASVLATIDTHGPITDRDLEAELGWPMGTGAKRRHDLAREGLVDRTGQSKIAWTGHRGDLWHTTELGQETLKALGLKL